MNNQHLNTPRLFSGAVSLNRVFLLIAWISGVVVWFSPQVGVWFTGFTLLFGLYLGLRSRLLITHNLVNIPLSVFLITALVGVWAAYDQQAAFHKFLILFAAVMIMYALSSLGSEDLSVANGLISLTAMLLAGYFLLSHNWKMQPADLKWINVLGALWMEVRPTLPSIYDSPNIPAGILAMMYPLVLTDTWQTSKTHRVFSAILAWSSLIIVTIAIVMSSSRAVWGILVFGLITLVWWELSSRGKVVRRRNPIHMFLSGLAVIGIGLLVVLIVLASQMKASTGILPGQSSATTRLYLYNQTTHLISDFWLTGGGLRSFAGLYSEYILDIPYLFYTYAHNLILDITLEQGIFGVVSFVLIYAVTFWMLINGLLRSDRINESGKLVLIGLLISIMVIWGHGMVDNSLYGVQGTPFLFLIPGLIVGFDKQLALADSTQLTRVNASLFSQKNVVIGLSLLGIISAGLFMIPPIRSAIQANVGAVNMAKLELAGFPVNSWKDGLKASEFSKEIAIFQNAMASDPDQRTANYCMGRIAMQEGDYHDASQYLLTAYKKDPNHVGIQKHLGYSYVWLGKFAEAYPLIRTIPGAENELANYSTWWMQQGNPTLAMNANLMYEYFLRQK